MSKRGGGFFLRLCASEFSEFFEGANKLRDEAIFVIVPGDRFHQLSIAHSGNFRLRGIKHRTEMAANDIGRDYFFIGITK